VVRNETVPRNTLVRDKALIHPTPHCLRRGAVCKGKRGGRVLAFKRLPENPNYYAVLSTKTGLARTGKHARTQIGYTRDGARSAKRMDEPFVTIASSARNGLVSDHSANLLVVAHYRLPV
jgi:hypothetical protein